MTRSSSSASPAVHATSRAVPAGGSRAGSATAVATAWWWVRSVGSWVVLLVVLAVVGLTVALPTLAGGTAYTVLSPSMRPSLPPGALVVTRPVQADDVAVGDVVTYQIRSGEPAVITHRVTALRLTADGQTLLQTKGDNNNAFDPDLVTPAQLRGRLWYSVGYLGYLNSTIAGHGRVAVVGLVVVGLLGYAGWMFTSAARDRRRAPAPASAAITAPATAGVTAAAPGGTGGDDHG